MHEQRNCPHCGTTFIATSKYPEQKYCSKECGYAAKIARSHIERTCATCGKVFLAAKAEIKRRGGKYCSRDCYRANPPRTGSSPEQIALMKVERKGAGNPCYRGDAVTLGSAHDRIRAAKGRAGEYDCVNCGRPARDWALRHDAEQTKTARNGRVYSLNVDDYMPMCRRCHWHYDHPDGAPERYFGANAWRAA
jgi:hypothetical protein